MELAVKARARVGGSILLDRHPGARTSRAHVVIGAARRILASWLRPAPAPAPAPGLPCLSARYLDHNFPRVAAAGAVSVVRVVVENAGPGTWSREGPDDIVALAAFIDGRIIGSGRFLAATVAPGEKATLAVMLTWPSAPGEHRLKLDLFVPDRVFFSNAGTPALDVPLSLRPAETTPTEALRGSL